MALSVPIDAGVYQALHSGTAEPDTAAPKGKRRGSGTHHRRHPPRQALFHQLSECLAHYELQTAEHDRIARKFASDLRAGLGKLGL